jgi:hypothetical protein
VRKREAKMTENKAKLKALVEIMCEGVDKDGYFNRSY